MTFWNNKGDANICGEIVVETKRKNMNAQINKIPIVMICDRNFVMQTCVALTSLRLNKKDTTAYEVFVIVADCDNESASLLEKTSCADFSVRVIDTTLDKYKDIKQLAHVPLASLLKFDICELIPQYDKLLYLDGDMIIRQDLSELYQTGLADDYVAGVAHSLGVLTGEKKLNGGVLLFNASKIRQEALREVFISTRQSLGNRKSMDQETFHIVFGDKKVYLPPRYNVMLDKLDYEKKYYSIKDYNIFFQTAYKSRREILDTAAIIHFTGGIKPWNYQFAKCGDEWREYYKAVFGDDSELHLKGRMEFYREQFKKSGWKGIYWHIKDHVLALLGECFHIFPDKSHGEWN